MSDSAFQKAAGEELFIVQFDEEACNPGHSYGPAIRDYYLIHFVASGKGIFQHKNGICSVSAGQGFLILPGEETFYQADEQEPWHYAWVGYRGSRAELLTRTAGLNDNNRIFTAPDPSAVWQAMETMRTDARLLRLSQLSAIGSLLRFFSLIAPIQDPDSSISLNRQYCERALWFMQGRFDRDVSIQETADFVGLSRSHLYRVMMEEQGCSPKALLLKIRMQHAEQMLRETTLTLDEIALRVGLRTGAQLGVSFRSIYGISPGKYRKNQ